MYKKLMKIDLLV